jgi:hypothetical protein
VGLVANIVIPYNETRLWKFLLKRTHWIKVGTTSMFQVALLSKRWSKVRRKVILQWQIMSLYEYLSRHPQTIVHTSMYHTSLTSSLYTLLTEHPFISTTPYHQKLQYLKLLPYRPKLRLPPSHPIPGQPQHYSMALLFHCTTLFALLLEPFFCTSTSITHKLGITSIPLLGLRASEDFIQRYSILSIPFSLITH